MQRIGQKAGFPRFKSFDRMESLVYPKTGFSLGKKLKLTPFGDIAIKKHREIKGITKRLTLKREASGKLFAIFCVQESDRKIRKNNGGRIGIDLGLLNFAILSNNEVIKNPRHFKKHEEHLAFLQRRLSRCMRGSRNRRKARVKAARRHEKIANHRSDFLHKLSTSFVNSYSLIAMEKLNSQSMAKKNYGKSINDAGWGRFANMLAYKAEGAGCRIAFVNPENTTKECSHCSAVVDKCLSERVHNCPLCGLYVDRDLNAAVNILKRATAGTAESNASGDGTIVSSMKEDARPFKGG